MKTPNTTENMKPKHFFYGSLRSGFWNNRRVIGGDSKLVAVAMTEGKIPAVHSGRQRAQRRA